MEPVNLFKLAASHNAWLAARQVTVASNVANADTPGYRAVDVEPFSVAISEAGKALAVTSTKHVATTGAAGGTFAAVPETESWATKHTGNSVSIEQELLKAQEIRKSYALNTSIIKAFHSMLLAATKG